MQIVNLFISAILQILIFAAIPFVWWLVSGRKQTGFFTWLGIRKPRIENKGKYAAIFAVCIVLWFIPTVILIPHFISESSMATSQFSGQGLSALLPVLIYAFLQTGFSEELFFRGFLTKRFIRVLGFQGGNVLQAALFGLMHGLMVLPSAGWGGALAAIVVTAAVGYIMGWMNEKQSGGSIMSSWLMHGCVNTAAALGAAFQLM